MAQPEEGTWFSSKKMRVQWGWCPTFSLRRMLQPEWITPVSHSHNIYKTIITITQFFKTFETFFPSRFSLYCWQALLKKCVIIANGKQTENYTQKASKAPWSVCVHLNIQRKNVMSHHHWNPSLLSPFFSRQPICYNHKTNPLDSNFSHTSKFCSVIIPTS